MHSESQYLLKIAYFAEISKCIHFYGTKQFEQISGVYSQCGSIFEKVDKSYSSTTKQRWQRRHSVWANKKTHRQDRRCKTHGSVWGAENTRKTSFNVIKLTCSFERNSSNINSISFLQSSWRTWKDRLGVFTNDDCAISCRLSRTVLNTGRACGSGFQHSEIHAFYSTTPFLQYTNIKQWSSRSQWSSGNTLACGARGPRFESRCGQKFVFSRKSLRYTALGTGCTLTAVPRSTQPSTLRGTVNEYQP